jgi:virulence-associated protein VapD
VFAIAFDLVVAKTAEHHPKGVSQAYADRGAALGSFAFNRVVYYQPRRPSQSVQRDHALKALLWLPESVRDIGHSK